MNDIQEIKARLDITDYIQRFVPDLKKTGRNFKACCPFHAENTPSFVVTPDTQSWRCFGSCADGGDIFEFAMRFNGWDFVTAKQELAREAGVELVARSPQQVEADQRRERLRGLLSEAAENYHRYLLSEADDVSRVALVYATEKRGFTRQTLEDWQIGLAPDGWTLLLDRMTEQGHDVEDIIASGLAVRSDRGRVYDRFRNRLMIPIHDERGRVVGFGARALLAEDNPKYLNSPQNDVFDKSQLLFGYHRASRAIRDSETVVIVEGYMDVIQAHQAGFHNVVAQMGTALTETQLQRVAPPKANRIVLALDSDQAGQNATRRSLEVIQHALQSDFAGRLDVDMRVLQIEGAKDPDDILRETPDVWAAAVENAIPVADFLIRMETAQLTADSAISERQRIARSTIPLLTATEKDVYRNDNLQKLSLALRLSMDDLRLIQRELRQEADARRTAPRPVSMSSRSTSSQGAAPADNGAAQPSGGHTSYHAPDDSNGSVSYADEPPHWASDDDDYQPYYDELPARHDSAHGSTSGSANGATPATTHTGGARPNAVTAGEFSLVETEIALLGRLLRNLNYYFKVVAWMRQLAGFDPVLVRGDLASIVVDDFTQPLCQKIVGLLLEGFEQHEEDPLAYIDARLADSERSFFRTIQVDFAEALHHQYPLLPGDVAELLQLQHTKQQIINEDDAFARQFLELRLRRIKREVREIQYTLQASVRALPTGGDDSHTDRADASTTAAQQAALVERMMQLISARLILTRELDVMRYAN